MNGVRAPVVSLTAAAVFMLAGVLASQSPAARGIQFVDVAVESGITFKHDNAASKDKYLIETMGSGAAWLDYDGDGYLDVYLVNSAATKAYTPSKPLRSALYHNNGDGTFTDVTERAGVAAEGLFGMGAAVGDFDNDGLPDLYVAGYGKSILYRNNGDGTFVDVTAKAGVANLAKWGSSAAWFDYDRDGWLDLVVVNYLDFTPERNEELFHRYIGADSQLETLLDAGDKLQQTVARIMRHVETARGDAQEFGRTIESYSSQLSEVKDLSGLPEVVAGLLAETQRVAARTSRTISGIVTLGASA